MRTQDQESQPGVGIPQPPLTKPLKEMDLGEYIRVQEDLINRARMVTPATEVHVPSTKQIVVGSIITIAVATLTGWLAHRRGVRKGRAGTEMTVQVQPTAPNGRMSARA